MRTPRGLARLTAAACLLAGCSRDTLLEVETLESIRIGTKALAYWPQRFVTDPDADDTLRLFEQVVNSGKNLAFMAHFSHPRELEPDIVREAVRRMSTTSVFAPEPASSFACRLTSAAVVAPKVGIRR